MNEHVQEFDGETTITLRDTDAAFVVTPEEYLVYIPQMEEDDEVPGYIVLLMGIVSMMSNDDFVERVLQIHHLHGA